MKVHLSRLKGAWQRLRNQRIDPSGSSHVDIPSDPAELSLLSKNDIIALRKQALNLIDAQQREKTVLERDHGENHSPAHGVGLDYEESRTYQPGDELRLMNWRITARTNEPHVKIFQEERHPSVLIMLDRRQSMRFGTRTRLKVTQALRLAVLQAFYLHYKGWRISSAILEDTLRWLDFASDEPSLLTLISIMNNPCPPQKSNTEDLSLYRTLRLLLSTLCPGTRILLFSDFIGLDSESRVLLSNLAERHNVSAFHIIDPAEITLPNAGYMELSSQRTIDYNPAMRTIDTSEASINNLYTRLSQQHLSQYESLIRRCGAKYYQVMTAEDHIGANYLLM